ncbi:putative retrovirus-related Pol polyprotein from transposon [Phytophthora infestans]|uniref:Putative retrovirus-related Pol polyprotein from transposon n=1 Tax=Phytophthora infestans TaxID=4787 RepID=A0A833SMV5_PHYIN|nr:putative retrovirus-related Pol polyprotein from transposon [Phytophthora infestans]
MERIGYSADVLLVPALNRQPDYDGGGSAVGPAASRAENFPLSKIQRLQYKACYDHPVISDMTPFEDFAFTPKLVTHAEAAARDHGPSFEKYADNYRVQFRLDPSVTVTPFKVRLKPGAVPVKCKARRYALLHRISLDAHVKDLLDAMLIRENSRSRWCSPPRIMPKMYVNDLRMTIDDRAVNACTEPMPFPMPQLDVVITHVEGPTVFFSCDWFRGYCQLTLDPESQQYFTFVTHRGMYRSQRVPMGS